MVLDVNDKRKRKYELGFPDLYEEGKKYGLSEQQLSRLLRYLNDERLLRVISLEQFNQNARAWLSALTGIIAEVFAMDAHVSIWMNKKLERPRNWILNKLNEFIPTKIDDIIIKAATTAQKFTDDNLLPLKEKVLSDVSSKMHDKYQYHVNSNHLGYSLKELKDQQKERLQESKASAQDAIKTLKKRQFQASILGGKYRDDNGYWHDTSKYQTYWDKRYITQINERIKRKNETNKQQEKPQEEINSKEGVYP